MYNLKDEQISILLKIIDNYQKNIFIINLYSSIQTQLELIGKIDKYKIDVKPLVGNLLKFVENKKIKKKLNQLKMMKGNYYLIIDEIKDIISTLKENLNKEIEPMCKIDYKNIKSIKNHY